MGVSNRDYMRERSVSWAWAGGSRVTWWLIGINALLWFVAAGSLRSGSQPGRFLYEHFVLQPSGVIEHGRIWQVVTAFWMHAPQASHVVFNMLLLFFFGRSVEQRLGARSYLVLYLLGGLTSTVVVIPVCYLFGVPDATVVGASGALYAVMVYLALVEPHRTVLFFGIVPMPLWFMVGVLMVGGELLQLGSRVPISAAGHLAGGFYGFLHVRYVGRSALALPP